MENQREKTEKRLPEAFCAAMQELLGGDYDAYLDSFTRKPSVGIRINRLKISVSEFLEQSPFALRPVSWTENGFYVENGAPVSRHPWYAAGLYYIQEPSAMLPAARLPVEPGDRVLDLCAAPGGKATELGSLLAGQGLLVANDISASRARGLLKNLERFGIGNVFVSSEEPERLVLRYGEFFDKILVDAPCSGEGMFRRDPAMVKNWLQRGPSYYCEIQKRLLSLAWKMLRPGGLLLYSTCTFSVMENEDVIRCFLEAYPDMELCSMPICEGFAKGICRENDTHPELERCVRLFPHRIEGEGHFAALLKKRNAGTEGTTPVGGMVAVKAADLSDKISKRKKQTPEKRDSGGKWHLKARERFKCSRGSGHVQSAEKRQNTEKGNRSARNKTLEGEAEASWRAFAEQIRGSVSGQAGAAEGQLAMSIVRMGDYFHGLPEGTPIPDGVRFLRTGLLLGSFQKKRFTPSQALAMYLNPEQVRQTLRLAEEDSRVKRYLRGETLELSAEERTGLENGWVLVCVDRYGLGWGRLVGETLRNKYEPGWRDRGSSMK